MDLPGNGLRGLAKPKSGPIIGITMSDSIKVGENVETTTVPTEVAKNNPVALTVVTTTGNDTEWTEIARIVPVAVTIALAEGMTE